jgi:ABC-type Zn uptake system ZnuABC Zn-binding protein ZnuA
MRNGGGVPFRTLAAGFASILLLTACATSPEPLSEGQVLLVATTVSPLTSIAAQVGGDRVNVQGIVPEGTNSHTFEPPPSAAALLSRADLVFLNGLMLEEPTRDLAEANLKQGARIVEIGDEVIARSEWIFDFSFPERDGKPNPHLWTDPTLTVKYATKIRDSFIDMDPEGAIEYRANHDLFVTEVKALEAALISDQATLPREARTLLTYHDAYAYFARTYDWSVIGAIQPSNFDDPTPREVARLIDQVRKTKVAAIFGSEVFPSKVLEQIGQESNVRYIDTLRDDDLPGEPGDSDHSWQGLMRLNFITMIEGLGGQAPALRGLTIRPVGTDSAVYPQ